MLTSKSPPHSTKHERFHEMKRYLESLNKQQTSSTSSQVYQTKSGANPYLSPLSLGRLQQLQIGKKLLKEMRGQPQQYHTTLNSPNSRTSGVPTIQIPKRIALNQTKEVDASHGVISHQIKQHGESNRSQSKSKKPVVKNYSDIHESLHQHYLAASDYSMSPLSPELVSETRLDPNSRHYRLHLQPWSIYYIPGNDPNTFITPPIRKIPPNEKIERELKEFKKEIDEKFAKTPMKNFVFPRSFSIHSQDDEFTEYGDDLAFITDTDEEAEESQNEGRMLSSPPYPGALLQHQQLEARKQLKTGSASRGVRPSPLRQVDLVDQRSKISSSSSKEACENKTDLLDLGGSGTLPKGVKNRNLVLNTGKQTKLVPYGYGQHSQAVTALVSPTTRAYESKKMGFMNVAKNLQKRQKGPSKTMNYSDYDRLIGTGQYPATSMPSTRAWEDSQLISPKIMSHGGGTGSALTPPPCNLSDSTFDNNQQQQGSPRNMTHRSFILPGDKVAQKYLHKANTHSKSQHYKQKFVPGGAIGPPAEQAFTPVVGRVMKKSRTPRQLLSQDQIQPPQSVPLNTSPVNKGLSNAPGGGTGSITYHQAETTTANSSSYRSLRQGTSSQSSRKPQPLQEMNIPLTPSKQNSKYAGTARQRVLPPELIASYLKQSPHGQRPLTTQNRAAQSVQKHYPTGYATQYHGKWSILGSTSYTKSPHDSLIMSHESVKTKGGTYRGVGHQRSKTSHVESSQSQLGVASDAESVNPKTSGRANQSQFSAGRKKKKSLKNAAPGYLPKQNTFELNTSYDTVGGATRAMHSSTLSRELNMINQELQNADKTMKLLSDAEDLKLGYLKHNHPIRPQQQAIDLIYSRSAVRNLGLQSPHNSQQAHAPFKTSPHNTYQKHPMPHASMPISPSSGNSRIQSPQGNMQEQYKKRFKNPVQRDTEYQSGGSFEAPPPTGALSRSSQRDQ